MNSSETSAAGSSSGTKGPGRIRTRLPRNAIWVAALRNALSQHRPRGRVSYPVIESGAEAAVDGPLNELWEKYACDDDDTLSPFAKKIVELKTFYEQKLQEIAAREAEYTSPTPEGSGGEAFGQDDPEVIQKAIKRTLELSARRQFSTLRLQIKNKVLETIVTLRDTYVPKGTKRSLPSAATKAMNTWFQNHSSDPYPSDAEKEAFTAEYGITMDQVTTWFTNKRYRNRQKD